jgi:putative transposase
VEAVFSRVDDHDEHQEKNKYLNRLVYNDWELHSYMQMLTYKSLRYGKEIYIITERKAEASCLISS